jgi:heme exporter protein CcmD
MMEFLSMGGYAQFVWPSYALTFAIVFLNIWWARRALAQAREHVQRRIAITLEEAT